jgi:hypothetical protein
MSSVGEKGQPTSQNDFTVTFRDSQELHAFQEKLGRVLSALQYNSQVMSSLHKKLQTILKLDRHQKSQFVSVANEKSWLSRLGDVREETLNCQRNIIALIKRVQGIATLVRRDQFWRSL